MHSGADNHMNIEQSDADALMKIHDVDACEEVDADAKNHIFQCNCKR